MGSGELIVKNFVNMIQPIQMNIEQQIQTTEDNNKVYINLYVKRHPYHDDTIKIAEFDFDNEIISFYEQHRILFQDFLEKLFKPKRRNSDHIKSLKDYYDFIIAGNNDLSIIEKDVNTIIEKLSVNTELSEIKPLFIEALKKLDFEVKNLDDDFTIDKYVPKLIKVISGYYTKSWIKNNRLQLSFDLFDKFYSPYSSYLANVLNKIINNLYGYNYGKQVIEKIAGLIKPDYLNSAKLIFNLNSGDTHSAVITLENNPWRNGVIKGDLMFARIKAEGKEHYIYFKNSLTYFLNKNGIKFSANNTDERNGFIKIELSYFLELLNNCNDDFRNILQRAFLRAISFPEFGCCSKYNECENAGRCLHCDQLYATACQFQKLLKRTGKFE